MYTPLLRDLGVAASQFCAGSLPDSEFSHEYDYHQSSSTSTSSSFSSFCYSESARVRIIENPIYEPSSKRDPNSSSSNNVPFKSSSSLTRFHCVNMCQYLRFRNFNEFENISTPQSNEGTLGDDNITATRKPSDVKVSSSSRLYEHAAQRILGWIENPTYPTNTTTHKRVQLTQREVCVAMLVSNLTYEAVQSLVQQYGLLSLQEECQSGGKCDNDSGGGLVRDRCGRFHDVAMDTLLLRKEAVCNGGHSVALGIDLTQYFDVGRIEPQSGTRVGQKYVREYRGSRSRNNIDHVSDDEDDDDNATSAAATMNINQWDLSLHNTAMPSGMPSLDPCLMALRRREHIRAIGAILPMVHRRVMSEVGRLHLTLPHAPLASSKAALFLEEFVFDTNSTGTTLHDRLASLLVVGNSNDDDAGGGSSSPTLPMGVSEAVDAVAAQLTRLYRLRPQNGFTQTLTNALTSGSFESSIDLKTSLFGERTETTASPLSTQNTYTSPPTTPHKIMLDTVFHMAHRQSAPEDVHSVSYKRRYARALAERAAIIAQQPQSHNHHRQQQHQAPTPSTPMKAPEQHYFPPSFTPTPLGTTEDAPIRNVVLLRSWEVHDYELDGTEEDSSERMLLDLLTTTEGGGKRMASNNTPSSSPLMQWDLIVVQGPIGHAHHALLEGFRLHRRHTLLFNDDDGDRVDCGGGLESGGVIVLANAGGRCIERMAKLLQQEQHQQHLNRRHVSSPTDWINGSGRVMHLSVPYCGGGVDDRLEVNLPIIYRPDTTSPISSSSYLVLTMALNAGYDVVTANQLTSEQVSNEDRKARLNPSMMVAISSLSSSILPSTTTPTTGDRVHTTMPAPTSSLEGNSTTINLPLVSVWITTTSEIRLSCVKQSFWDTITFLTRVLSLMCCMGEDWATCNIAGEEEVMESVLSRRSTHIGSYLSGLSTSISTTIVDRISPIIRRLLHPREVVIAHTARRDGLGAALRLGMEMGSRLCVEVPAHQ